MYARITVDEWGDIKAHAHQLHGWVFRGQSSATWGLRTSIERLAEAGGTLPNLMRNREKWILRQFRSRAHLVMASPPDANERLEWLSAIQHYGGPTRLLDFTCSFYVATFFAVDSATGDASIWAINRECLDRGNNINVRLPIDVRNDVYVDKVDEVLRNDSSQPGVIPVEPPRLNERMAVQKGLFMFPTDIRQSFFANLQASVNFDFANNHENARYNQKLTTFLQNPHLSKLGVVKFVLPKAIHREIVFDLAAMNVDASTLFPGLEGFARSLQRHLRLTS